MSQLVSRAASRLERKEHERGLRRELLNEVAAWRDLRLSLGVPQVDVAEEAGVPQGQVSRFERGDHYGISLARLQAIANVYRMMEALP